MRKFLSFPLENLNGKLIFDHFLPLSSIPEAVGEFFRFNFSHVRFGVIFRLLWIKPAWGVPPPCLPSAPGKSEKSGVEMWCYLPAIAIP